MNQLSSTSRNGTLIGPLLMVLASLALVGLLVHHSRAVGARSTTRATRARPSCAATRPAPGGTSSATT